MPSLPSVVTGHVACGVVVAPMTSFCVKEPDLIYMYADGAGTMSFATLVNMRG
jgi:hypothetical protein